MSDERDDATASGLVDVVIPPFHWFYDQLRVAGPVLLIVIPFIFVVFLIVKGTSGIGSISTSDTVIGIALSFPVILFISWFMRKRMSRVRKLAEQLADAWGDESDATMIHQALECRPSGTDLLLFHELGKALATRGFRGRVFRLGYDRDMPVIKPFDVSFEPRVLDESDAAFVDLLNAIDGDPIEVANGMEGIDARDRQARTSIQRKLKLMGGQWTSIILAFPLLMAAIESYRERRVSVLLIVFTFSFLMQLFGFLAPNWKFPHAHFLPGGIVVAAGSYVPKRKSRLRMMSRDHCVLFVIQRQPSIWEIIVSDGEDAGVARATLTEATTLLRAWMSPIAAPPEEMVVNMVYQNKEKKSQSQEGKIA